MNVSTMVRRRRALVFDSGLGGLTVFARIAEARPDLELVYAADDAFFPYGALGEAALVERVGAVMDDLIARTAPDVVVIACNTASTLVLPPLRAAYPHLPFVGTVPAIKPAAEASKSRMISVLATPGTVARDYTRALVRDFAAGCEVDPGRRGPISPGSPNGSCAASRSRTPTWRAKSSRASSRWRGGAPTRSCSPARIFRY